VKREKVAVLGRKKIGRIESRSSQAAIISSNSEMSSSSYSSSVLTAISRIVVEENWRWRREVK
jgi:hypothetical protein